MLRRRSLFLAAALTLLAGTVVAIVVARTTQTDGSGSPGSSLHPQQVTIRARDGVDLTAYTFTPAGPGRHALIVMPTPFDSPASVYVQPATALARLGYEVVTYVQRGFAPSGGRVDFAGPATQADASTVITWALAHTPAEPKHVGMLGMSYGAAISLLAAAHDSRIRAVAAIHTWTDFGRTFLPNNTPSTAALAVLLKEAAGRLDPSIASLGSESGTPAFAPALAKLAAVRSPQSYVAALNRNRPAILIANAFEDSYLPPLQVVRFFDDLHVPKRLELAAGDHTTLRYSALRDPSRTGSAVPDAVEWLDHYLRGAANGVPSWRPLRLIDATTGTERDLAAWPRPSATLELGRPNTGKNIGGAPAAWSARLPSDRDSGADLGRLGAGLASGPAPACGPGECLAWSGRVAGTNVEIGGTLRLHVRMQSTAATATVFAYVYDVTPSGNAALITGEPYTATGLHRDTVRSVSFDLQPIAWTVPAGDHLELVIDTSDPRFSSPTPAGRTITLSSTVDDPAVLAVPAS